MPYRRARFAPLRQSCLPERAHYARPSAHILAAHKDSTGCARPIRSSLAAKQAIPYLASLCSRAVLIHISGGTSYQTARLVFRPYARLMPSICTSERRTASSCLSPAFAAAGHSSQVYRVAAARLPRPRCARGSAPAGSPRSCTPWSVFQDGTDPLGWPRNFTFSCSSSVDHSTSPLSVLPPCLALDVRCHPFTVHHQALLLLAMCCNGAVTLSGVPFQTLAAAA